MDDILVPTDFTGVSDTAADTAMKLAKKSNCEVIFLHLISPDDDSITFEKHANAYEKTIMYEVREKNKQLEEYIIRAREDNIPASTAVQLDKQYRSLIDFVDKHQVFLLVMGTHGAKGTRELFVGSNAQKVARYCPIPVLTVKAGYGSSKYNKMAYFSDFNFEDIEGYKKITKIAEKFHIEIDLVAVSTPDRFFSHRKAFDRLLHFKSLKPNLVDQVSILNSYSVEQGMHEYCERNPVDMVSLVTHKRTGLKKLTNQSFTEYLINRLKLPILSVHNTEEETDGRGNLI